MKFGGWNIGGKVVKDNDVYTVKDNTELKKPCSEFNYIAPRKKYLWAQT